MPVSFFERELETIKKTEKIHGWIFEGKQEGIIRNVSRFVIVARNDEREIIVYN